tara:strand:- start:6315 stop:9395 length:3081 start_codon:yes stop_codon:yes gene_type:complete
MADGPHINKFETVDLASFYKDNGSQFSNIQPSNGLTNSTGPEISTTTNKTPISGLTSFAPEVGVFTTPNSPAKIGIDTAGFLFSPAFTAPEVSAFGFIPGFTTSQLKIVNGIPDIDASGFTKNMTYPNSAFKGISKSNPLTFTSARLSTQLKVHNGLADIDMNGFITGKKHLGQSDFTGIVGSMPNLSFGMSTINPGTTSTWTRQQYNEKVGGGYNAIADIKQSGFNLKNLGQYRGNSDFIGIDGNNFTYPTTPTTNGSYGFAAERYDSVFAKITPSSVPGKTDSIGQQYKLFGGTSPYGDTSISARKSQFNSDSFDSKIQKQYLEIPGVGETNLRRESTNVHSFGPATDQPFIQRDIGSNWSLFSDSPGSKGGKGSLLSIDLIRGGVGTAINRSLVDALRIGKFLISPKGLLFIAKNVGMQLTNPKMQTDKILGIGANRIYALGLPTLAQSLTNAVGIHLVRHGLGPLNGQLKGSARYEDNIFQSESPLSQGGAGQGAKSALKKAGFDSPDTSDLTDKSDVNLDSTTGDATTLGKGSPRTKSRLAYLQTDMKSGLLAVTGDEKPEGFGSLAGSLSSKIPGFTRGMGKTKITRLSDKGFLGPGSVYGIGGTSIFRSNAGIGINQHEQTGGTYADSKYFSGMQAGGENPSFARVIDTPDDGNKYSDKNGTNTYDDMFAEGGNASQQALILDNILSIDGVDAAPDDSSTQDTSGGHQPFPTLEEGNLYVSNNQRLRRYQTLGYGMIPRSADRIGNKLMDFRELLDNTNKNFQRPNDGDATALPWEGLDRMTRFGGNYGSVTSADGGSNLDVSNRKVDLGLDDTVVDASSITPGTVGETSAEYADVFDDFINFKFSSKRPGAEEEILQFRAYLDGISDSFNYGWQDISYVGRTTPTYLFQSVERGASFNFKLYSMTRAEMEANYKRLNRFIQMTSPEFKSGLPVGPLLKLTIGDWWKENPFIIDSFTMTPVDNAPWDIDEGRQLPFYVDCAVSGKILFSKANIGGAVTDRVHSSTTDAFAAITNDSWRQ